MQVDVYTDGDGTEYSFITVIDSVQREVGSLTLMSRGSCWHDLQTLVSDTLPCFVLLGTIALPALAFSTDVSEFWLPVLINGIQNGIQAHVSKALLRSCSLRHPQLSHTFLCPC